MSGILFSVDGHLARVHLCRPEALNAIDGAMDVALRDAWNAINADPEIRVVLLTGEGEKAFCVGGDIKDVTPRAARIALGGGITGIGGPLLAVTKPIVAAVQGYALGGGFELAMCADIIVAADTAQFGLPETMIGLIGESGVVHRAIRQLPHHVALAMILAGVRLSATEGHRHGLVNEVVAAGALAEAAGRWCDRLLAASPLAVQAAKAAALSGLDYPLADALASRFEAIEHYASSIDYAESRTAFRDKRKPRWQGR
jgi:enoyl-CoA hydratase/carnithine racemase